MNIWSQYGDPGGEGAKDGEEREAGEAKRTASPMEFDLRFMICSLVDWELLD